MKNLSFRGSFALGIECRIYLEWAYKGPQKTLLRHIYKRYLQTSEAAVRMCS